jgi:alkanesulfonate monooxygenase SsuD/methylene tetrahydromethanopterin reductase-like flavin-dependent oxidoreductase (luciferase family)
MKVGLFINTQFPQGFNLAERVPEMIEQVRAAHDAGFASLWFPHHWLTHPMQMLQITLVMGYVAAHAQGMTIGPNILILRPLNPMHVAEEAVTLDVLTGGNYILGVGLGYRQPEFDAFGISLSERAPRFNESIALMRRLWTEERVSHKGRFYAVDNAGIGVKPVGPPLPITVECCVGARHSTAHAECRGPLEYKYNAYASWGLQSRTTQGSFEDFARPVHHRRQALGERRNRTISRASGRRSFYHALPVTRTAAGASAELDPAAWRYFRGVGSVGALVTWPAFQVSAARPR